MTDFAKLTGSPKAIDESLEAFEFAPEGCENGAGSPLVLTMHPTHGTRFKKATRLMQVKEARRTQGKEAEQPADLTDEEAEKLMAENAKFANELLARCCDGWNMTDGEKPLPFDLDIAKTFFEQLEPVREAALEAMDAEGKRVKATKAA